MKRILLLTAVFMMMLGTSFSSAVFYVHYVDYWRRLFLGLS